MARSITRRTALGALAASAAALRIPAAHAAETLRVGKAVVDNMGFIPLDIGLETGIFERNGVAVEKVDFGGAARLHQAMVADSVDIGLSAGPEMAFIAKGAPEIAVAAISESASFMAIVAASQSDIHGVEDLKGKRIGITSTGTLTDWLVQELNRVKGWTKEGERATTVAIGGATPGQIAALKTGAIDATVNSLQAGYFAGKPAGRAHALRLLVLCPGDRDQHDLRQHQGDRKQARRAPALLEGLVRFGPFHEGASRRKPAHRSQSHRQYASGARTLL
jgi:ABC-type nitrate/sulfonate/bicarbonate transport system substrate-binding protein